MLQNIANPFPINIVLGTWRSPAMNWERGAGDLNTSGLPLTNTELE